MKKDIVKKTAIKLANMPKEDFMRELEKNKDGDITEFLIDTRATFLISKPPEEHDEKIYTLRYKDKDSDNSPWILWKSIGKPNEMLIKSLKSQGMYRLEILE